MVLKGVGDWHHSAATIDIHDTTVTGIATVIDFLKCTHTCITCGPNIPIPVSNPRIT
jgi:hypothetical protein